MVEMRYQARVGLDKHPRTSEIWPAQGRSVAIYNGMVYDITTYLTSPPVIRTPTGMQAPGDTDVNFMHGSVLDLFKKFNVGRDITKQLDHLNIDKAISSYLSRDKFALPHFGEPSACSGSL